MRYGNVEIKNRHKYLLQYHIIFVCKYRKKLPMSKFACSVGNVSEEMLRKCGKNIKTIAIFLSSEYTMRNRVARSLLDIGDQAESCAQLFYVKERFYGFKNIGA